MRFALQLWLALLFAIHGATVFAQGEAKETGPLAPLAHWVGGEWVTTFKLPNGAEIKAIRVYEWGFDGRVLIGRSFGESNGKRRQTRYTLYVWNPDSKRIEFTDVLDDAGYGRGFIEPRDGKLYMEAKTVGNDKHPPWRAWATRGDDGSETFRIEAEQQAAWKDYGTFVYRRQP